MKRQLYMGGGIMNAVPREQYGLGSIFKGAKKAVKGATKAVKKIASSDIGKAALIGAAAFGIPGTQLGGIFGRASFGGFAPGMFNFGGIGNALAAGKAKFFPGSLVDADDVALASQKALGKGVGEGIKLGTAGKIATLGLVSTFLTKSLGMPEEQAEAEVARDPSKYLELYYRNLNPPTADTNSEEYETQVRDFVIKNPFTTALFALGIKSMIPVKGFPKPKANPKFDSLMNESVNAFKTANEIKKGNIKPEDVAPSIQKLANFIKNPDIIDNTIKRAESKNYVLKQTPIADKKAIKIAKSELPDLLRNYVQTESKLYYENQNLTQNQISSLQRSKQTLSNLISENLIKVGNENTVTYLEGSTGIPKALAKKGVDALRKILRGETNVVLPRDFVDALKSKNPVRKANDIDEFFGSDYKKSAEIYEANDNKIQEFRFNNNVNNIKKIKSKIIIYLISIKSTSIYAVPRKILITLPIIS